MEYDDSRVQEAVRWHIYCQGNPDWCNLKRELWDMGYTEDEIFEILLNVREGVL
jgi:hypothetical protein